MATMSTSTVVYISESMRKLIAMVPRLGWMAPPNRKRRDEAGAGEYSVSIMRAYSSAWGRPMTVLVASVSMQAPRKFMSGLDTRSYSRATGPDSPDEAVVVVVTILVLALEVVSPEVER